MSGQGALLDNAGTAEDESSTSVSFAIATEGSDQNYPRVAVDATSGNYLVVWRDERNYAGSHYDVYGQVITSSGAL